MFAPPTAGFTSFPTVTVQHVQTQRRTAPMPTLVQSPVLSGSPSSPIRYVAAPMRSAGVSQSTMESSPEPPEWGRPPWRPRKTATLPLRATPQQPTLAPRAMSPPNSRCHHPKGKTAIMVANDFAGPACSAVCLIRADHGPDPSS